jgi:hypothetical protein
MPARSETLKQVIQASAAIAEREQVEAHWVAVNRRPACESTDRTFAGRQPAQVSVCQGPHPGVPEKNLDHARYA